MTRPTPAHGVPRAYAEGKRTAREAPGPVSSASIPSSHVRSAGGPSTPLPDVIQSRPIALGVQSEEGTSRPLTGPVIIASATADYRIRAGRVLIGRSPECAIHIADDTVSREHAALHVGPEQVVIEDLNSTNGVYIGGQRLRRRRALCDGDRVIIGSRQLTVFAWNPNDVNPTPVPGSIPPKPEDILPVETRRSNAVFTLARLAERMLAMGRVAEAERLLSEQLKRILDGARVGMSVPDDVFGTAASYSLKLAEATRRGAWVNYAVELHSRLGKPVTPERMKMLRQAVRSLDGVDWQLLECLRNMLIEADPADRVVADCVAGLDRLLLLRP